MGKANQTFIVSARLVDGLNHMARPTSSAVQVLEGFTFLFVKDRLRKPSLLDSSSPNHCEEHRKRCHYENFPNVTAQLGSALAAASMPWPDFSTSGSLSYLWLRSAARSVSSADRSIIDVLMLTLATEQTFSLVKGLIYASKYMHPSTAVKQRAIPLQIPILLL